MFCDMRTGNWGHGKPQAVPTVSSYTVIRVMTSHDACTSGTSRLLTVPSLQQLKMEALIPAPTDCEVRSKFIVSCARSMATHGSNKEMVRHWCRQIIAGRLQCMMRRAVGGYPSLQTILWSLCGNELWRIVASELQNSAVISRSLLHKIVTEHLLFRKIVCQMGAKATDSKTQSKAHGVGINISAAVP